MRDASEELRVLAFYDVAGAHEYKRYFLLVMKYPQGQDFPRQTSTAGSSSPHSNCLQSSYAAEKKEKEVAAANDDDDDSSDKKSTVAGK